MYRDLIKYPPILLLKEHKELKNRHSNNFPKEKWPRIYMSEVYVTTENRLTTVWKFLTKSKTLGELFVKYYGYLPKTIKGEFFAKQYEFYEAHKGRKLTDEEYEEYKRLMKKYSFKRISKDIINKKMKELFGREI